MLSPASMKLRTILLCLLTAIFVPEGATRQRMRHSCVKALYSPGFGEKPIILTSIRAKWPGLIANANGRSTRVRITNTSESDMTRSHGIDRWMDSNQGYHLL